MQLKLGNLSQSISRGVALKYVKNKRNRIRVKCEDQFPFVLLVSKDNNNLGLAVKTLVSDHNCHSPTPA